MKEVSYVLDLLGAYVLTYYFLLNCLSTQQLPGIYTLFLNIWYHSFYVEMVGDSSFESSSPSLQ